MGAILSTLKLILFLLWCCIMAPIQMVVLLFTHGQRAYVIPYYWHKGVCFIFGIRVKVIGTPVRDRQVMYVSNHLSYLDIPVMGSLLKASFIAKQEVAGWPVFGFLSKLQQTAFVDRTGARIDKDHYDLSNMLDQGKSLILFPEGTSSDGTALMPFKSRLFTLVIERSGGLPVQPFTVRLPDADTQTKRDRYAWYGDMDLAPHLWALGKTRGVTVELVFHDLIETNAETDRKELTEKCREIVAADL